MRVLSLFDGMSCGRIALERANIKISKYFASEIDKHAIIVSKKNYPDIIHIGDVQNINIEELGQIDLLIGGSPCFPRGTKVLTENGYKSIEDVQEGEKVLTHLSRLRPVVKTFNNGLKNLIRIKIQGVVSHETTEEHPYYVRTSKRIWNSDTRRYIRIFTEPEWVEAKDLNSNHLVCLTYPKGIDSPIDISIEEARLLGRYVANGYVIDSLRSKRKNSYNYKTVFCISKKKVEDFKKFFETYTYSPSEQRTVTKFVISNERFMNLAKMFGRGAANKKIPFWMMCSPLEIKKAFIAGYTSGDRYLRKSGTYKCSTVSEDLSLGLQNLVASTYNTPANVCKIIKEKTKVIEGRTVNQKNYFEVYYKEQPHQSNKSFFVDGCIWKPVVSVDMTDKIEDVFNLEVEEDNSYTVWNLVVHNCQGFSDAGHQLNFSDPRSSLFFEYVKILNQLKPKYFLLENVKMQKKFCDKITDIMGIKPILINSALVSAQNRNRLYWTNIPNITQPKDKEIKLQDILEYGCVDRNKSHCLDASYYKGGNLKNYFTKHRRQQVFCEEDKEVLNLLKNDRARPVFKWINNKPVVYWFYPDNTIEETDIDISSLKRRNLTVLECERLQTLPENYTKCQNIPSAQRYKMIGNGWTVDVLSHIFKNIQ